MKKIYPLILFILSISLAKSQDSKWTPEESMKIKSINQVNISNDGKYIGICSKGSNYGRRKI